MKSSSVAYFVIVICVLVIGCILSTVTTGQTSPTVLPSESDMAVDTTCTEQTYISTTQPTDYVFSDHVVSNPDGKMYAYWIRSDGKECLNFEIIVQASVADDLNKNAQLTYNIDLVDFRYVRVNGESDPAKNCDPFGFPLPYYIVSNGFCYDGVNNEIIGRKLAIDFNMGYLIMNFDDGYELYLVAAADPNVAAEDILSHFAGFIDSFGMDD